MKDVKRLLEARKTQKKRKPAFIRQDAHKNPKLDERWRRPKGSDNKMRLAKRGYRRAVSVGYRAPAGVRGLTNAGFERVKVARKGDLASIDPKTQCVVVASGTGMKKRMEILQECADKQIPVFNYKDPKEALDSMNELLKQKKEQKKKAAEVKKEKEKEKEEASKKKEEEEKQQQEAQEQNSGEQQETQASEEQPQEEEKGEDKSLDQITEEENKGNN